MAYQTTTQVDHSKFFSGFWREIRKIKQSKALCAVTLLYPIIIIFTMFYLFEQEVIESVPITVVDLDKTQSSRSLIQAVGSDSSVNVSARADSLAEAKDQLLRGEVFSILFVPNDYEKKMLGNQQPEVTVFSNIQYMSLGLTITKAFPIAFATHLGQIQAERLMTQGVDAQQAMRELMPISTDLHPVFNPTLNYVYTLVNGIVPTILQVIVMLSIAYTFIQDKYSQEGLLGLLRENGNSIFRLLVNKLLPYILAFLGALCIFDLGLIVFFDIPFNGSVTLELFSSLIFIISAALFAVVITIWIPSRAFNYGVISVSSSPAFGFMGLFFPRISMDAAAHTWSSMLPLTWYMEARLDQTLRDAGWLGSSREIIAMLIIGVVAYMLAVIKLSLLKKGAHHD